MADFVAPNTGTSAVTEYTYGTDSSCTSCGGAGQIKTLEKPDETTIDYDYDLAGRITEVDYSAIGGGPELTYDYDLASRVTSVTDTRLPFTNKTYTYDRDIGVTGFLTKITHPEGYTQEFFYNADKLEAYRDVDGSLIEYTYDAMGRISALADQFGGTTSWTYATTADTSFPVNGIKQVTFGNGVTQNFAFDNMGRMTGLQYKKSDGTTNIENLAFTYIENNLIQKIVRTSASNANPFKMIYDYDELNRVTKEAGRLNSATDVSTPLWSREYAFDAAGNRSSYKYNTTTSSSTYNDRNELQSVGSYDGVGNVTTGATSYAWDQNGNMDYRRWDNGYLQWDYDWTVDNKIKQVVYKDFVSGYSGSTTSTYTVDITNDYSHHKIMEKGSSSSSTSRKRYFFNGLTEEVTKTATINSDDAFAFQVEDAGNVTTGWSGSILSSGYDSARRSNVLSVTTGGGGSVAKIFRRLVAHRAALFLLTLVATLGCWTANIKESPSLQEEVHIAPLIAALYSVPVDEPVVFVERDDDLLVYPFPDSTIDVSELGGKFRPCFTTSWTFPSSVRLQGVYHKKAKWGRYILLPEGTTCETKLNDEERDFLRVLSSIDPSKQSPIYQRKIKPLSKEGSISSAMGR